jgi:hypothetical protein
MTSILAREVKRPDEKGAICNTVKNKRDKTMDDTLSLTKTDNKECFQQKRQSSRKIWYLNMYLNFSLLYFTVGFL